MIPNLQEGEEMERRIFGKAATAVNNNTDLNGGKKKKLSFVSSTRKYSLSSPKSKESANQKRESLERFQELIETWLNQDFAKLRWSDHLTGSLHHYPWMTRHREPATLEKSILQPTILKPKQQKWQVEPCLFTFFRSF